MTVCSTTLRVPTPFSLKATVLSHGWHECAPMSWSEGGRCFQVIERRQHQAYRVSVTEATRRKHHVTLRVTIDGRTMSDDVVAQTRRNVTSVLGLDRDLTEFYNLCRNHPILHIIPQIGAGRGLRSVSMTENIIKVLCSTNVTWSQAVKMINRLAQLGPALPHFANLNAWPTPRDILRAGGRYLLEVCRVGYRADSILTFCGDVCDGRIDPDQLPALALSDGVSTDDLLARLRSIRGIGPASAHYLLSFLGRYDRLAIDSSTVAHVARTHTNGRKPTHRQIEAVYEPYGRWKNLVWWCEHWLTWETAREILREAGIHTS
jgi:3-methyladenine DNA glycosylase/8-oxoguanine DNA glycosylase